MVTQAIARPLKKAPTEPGLYFARRSDEEAHWTLIVKIQGNAPYLTWVAWEIGEKGTIVGKGAPPYYFQSTPFSLPKVPEEDIMFK